MNNKISKKKIVRYLSGECLAEEKKQVEEAMKADSALNKTIKAYEKVWSAKKEKITVNDIDLKWQKMERMILTDLRKSQIKKSNRVVDWLFDMKARLQSPAVLIKYAVIYPLLLIGAYFLINNQLERYGTGIVEYNTVSVNTGKRKTVNLCDGTIVTLDAGSKLKYPVTFGSTRDVYLKGEAYFEVAKDSEHPFRVHLDFATVKVVGTKFNIRSWDENQKVTVTVVEGKVLLSDNKAMDSKSVFLTRGKQSSVSYLGEVAKPIVINPEKYINWMHNEIYFKNANLREILAQLERWYGYRFSIEDKIVADQTMTVHIRNVNVKEVINIISKITKTKIIQDGKRISFVSKNKNAMLRRD